MKPKFIHCLALLLGGMALCGAGLWLLLSPPQYAATARIKIEPDSEYPSGGIGYGGDFIQTDFQIMQSELVLSNVVTRLNLNAVWGRRYSAGEPLKYAECYAIIKNHLRFTLVRNTQMVDITYYSSDPKEAADVANAIGVGYKEYLTDRTARGFEILQQQYQDEEKQILVLQTNVEQLRQKYAIQDGASNRQSLEQQQYWDGKRQLDQLKELHAKRASIIEPPVVYTPMVEFVYEAEPPQFPVSTNRPVGAALLAVGLFPLLGGILLFKSKP